MLSDVFVLGLTGPTGAGKGTVGALLQDADIPVIDTDGLARVVTAPGSPCLQELASVFSPAVLHPDGSLDRARLAQLAFASPEETAKLNAITHPYIRALTEKQLIRLASQGYRVVVVDAPVLFESGFDSLCCKTVAVLADRAQRRNRLRQRDSLDDKQIDRRMSAQPDDSFYRTRADYILENNGDQSQLKDAVEKLICQIEEWLHAS